MLSYIMLFTNECCHVITLVFPLLHINLKIYVNIPATTRGVSPTPSGLVKEVVLDKV
jgi:hypothetical protein